jgi:hypothetical protein
MSECAALGIQAVALWQVWVALRFSIPARNLKVYLQTLLSIMLHLTSIHLHFIIYHSCPLLTSVCACYAFTVTD